MNNIRMQKKNDDGSYDDGEMLFKTVDLYGGDHQSRILEIAPAENVQEVKYVYFGVSLNDVNGKIAFTPEKEGSYLLVNSTYKNMKFYLEQKNGHKYYPDKNGLIKITDLLIRPIDVVFHVIAEKYSTNSLTEEKVFEEIEISVSGA